LGGFLENPKKPVLAVLGGAKVIDKLELISNMIDVSDEIIIGGGMVHPFVQEIFGFKLGSTKVQLPANR
jgi:phosphoglycerate kinase